jgi:hypothetical protein
MSTWHEKLANRKQNQLDEERKKKVEINDISYPSLCGGGSSTWADTPAPAPPPSPAGENKPKMASLVAKWDEDTKYTAEVKKVTATYSERPVFNHAKYYFGNTHSRAEDTYYEDEYGQDDTDGLVTSAAAPIDEGWRTVERPVRKPKKSVVDSLMEPEAQRVEDSIVWREEEESVWDRR